jgi:5-methylcytosine-specific restriction endonuclease McrA
LGSYSDETLSEVYDKNSGYCWYCEIKLAFSNYNLEGDKGAWRVGHSVPISQGGSSSTRNLIPVCFSCSRTKTTGGYSDYFLTDIYDKTDGYCQYCGMKLAYSNYAEEGNKGAWRVVHGRPISQGGTNHMNNLFPACTSCSKRKGSRRRPPEDW